MRNKNKKIRVLVIDDSALVRKMLTEVLNEDPDIEVVDTASDPLIARDKIKRLNPDVLTLDVEMPRMDGITFLGNLMRLRPMPVVMVSTLTEKGAEVTFQALELGAVDYVPKPKLDVEEGLQEYSELLREKVKIAANARVKARSHNTASPSLNADAVIKKNDVKVRFKIANKIIAIGASTGGTEAIKDVLMRMPADSPGIVISQHIPEAFSAPFAKRMDGSSAMIVCEARDGQQILPGHAYIAPGDSHLVVERNGARLMCRLNNGPPVNRHRPSVDVMFRSVAQCAGENVIGVILTGMGTDGAEGLKEIHDAGGLTIAQDEKSSVVWGMPGEAVKLGGVDIVAPLLSIHKRILDNLDNRNINTAKEEILQQ